ncbi:MAG: radical SAM protein [Phycisphaerales bacterium]|jgi:anaerobic magnesium-protoporphyrin IX monomethyl ester cyclase|nr:radical SAM protein [Phycisphaerales bacterium]MBT7170618.1 radical SAM protein [Phycisphaerales bacterium]
MRIALVHPPLVHKQGNIWRGVAGVMPPLGLAWIAAVLEEDGHDVQIFDAPPEGLDEQGCVDALRSRSEAGWDIVGISATTRQFSSALRIAQMCREAFSGVEIVLGGVHASARPDEALACDAIDLVVRGEGEMTFREIAAGHAREEIDGVSYRDGGETIHTADRELISDLDTIPRPAYHLLPMSGYRSAVGAAKQSPSMSMLATRGCVGSCNFCYRIFGRTMRYRHGVAIAEEVRYLHETYGIREISFYDDTFTTIRNEVLAFCAKLREWDLPVTWSCFGRIDSVNEELLTAMAEAGCHQILYGVESGSDQQLAAMGKTTPRQRVKEVVRLSQRLGLTVRGAFMLGNPGETRETMQQTLDWALELDCDLVTFNITTPYPGTGLYDWAEREGLLRSQDWDEYDLSHMVMELPTVMAEEVEAFYRKAYRTYYFRPRMILRRLWKLRSPRELFQAVRGALAILGL